MINNQGCTGAYTGPELTLSSSGGFYNILADRSIVAGFSVSVCLECTTALGTATLDNLSVTLVPVDCTVSGTATVFTQV